MSRLDPKSRERVTVGTVTLLLRPLSKRRKEELGAWIAHRCDKLGVDMSDADLRRNPLFYQETFHGLIRYMLVGWEGIDARFSSDMEANLDEIYESLSKEELAQLMPELERLSGLAEGEEKNSPASSASLAPARDSTAATETLASESVE